MRRVSNHTITKESVEDMLNARRFNPCLEITFRDKSGKHTHKLSAGYSDDVYVYRESSETLMLTHNLRLGYVGLEVFNGAGSVGNIFLNDHQVTGVFGRDDLAPFTMIRRLRPYVNP